MSNTMTNSVPYCHFNNNYDFAMGRALKTGELTPDGPRLQYYIKHLENVIKTYNPVSFTFQEGRIYVCPNGEILDSITPLTNFLKSHGYQVFTQDYIEDKPNCFKYLTAIRGDADVIKHDIRYINCGTNNVDVRCIFMTKIRYANNDIVIINVHISALDAIRLESSRIINEYVMELQKEDSELKIILCGDFNSFADGKDKVQLECITSLTHQPVMQEGNPITSSFIPFYNNPVVIGGFPKNLLAHIKDMNDEDARKEHIKIYIDKSLAKGSNLDHIFTSGFINCSTSLYMLGTDENAPKNIEDDDAIKKYVVEMYEKRIPPFCSDHQAILFIGEI